MKITLDTEIDAAYIYLDNEIKRGKVNKTYSCDPIEIGFELNLDFDKDNILIGIEIQNASMHLSKELLTNANKISIH